MTDQGRPRWSLAKPPLYEALDDATSVLIAGAGGGFDVYAALPLAVSLWRSGRRAHLANLSFTELDLLDEDAWLDPNVATVTAETAGPDDYFPERTLAEWLEGQGLPAMVYAFARTGVAPLRQAYRALVAHLHADAIVLVDGGTDILMRGDETGLGTPTEDMTSLGAVAGLDIPVKLVVCLGFGIDAYHGVNHVQVLENIGALDREGGYLGALSIPNESREAAVYRDAVAYANRATRMRPSIVNSQIAAALRGEVGDVHASSRTHGSRLFVNPLMGIYFSFDLDRLAARSLYLDRLEDTVAMRQVHLRIEAFRHEITPRTPRRFPH